MKNMSHHILKKMDMVAVVKTVGNLPEKYIFLGIVSIPEKYVSLRIVRIPRVLQFFDFRIELFLVFLV